MIKAFNLLTSVDLHVALGGHIAHRAVLARHADMRVTARRADVDLKVTGLLANTHLIEHTTPEVVLEGWKLAEKVAGRCGRPVRCVAVMEEHADDPLLAEIRAPFLRMQRRMLPPWVAPTEPADEPPVPAARSVPIGKPPNWVLKRQSTS